MNIVCRQLMRRAASAASGWHGSQRLSVLMYHRVLPQPDPMLPGVPHAAEADRQFKLLSQLFTVLPLDEAAQMLREGRLPPRAVCITFDDGYRDNHDVALPLLTRHGLTATVFVANGFLDGGRMFNDDVLEAVRRMPSGTLNLSHWNLVPMELSDAQTRTQTAGYITATVKYFSFEKRQAFCAELASLAESPMPDDLMMSCDEVRALARRGVSIGGHTVNHPILEKVDDDTAQREIVQNRDALRSLLDSPPRTFAYPNGKPHADYSARHAQMVRDAGYVAAVSTAYGVGDAHVDPFQIPRFVLTESSYPKAFLRLVRNTGYLARDYA